jgi:hypothetical protein
MANRVSQVAVEVLDPNPPSNVRVSQVAVEVLHVYDGVSHVAVSQVAVEVLVKQLLDTLPFIGSVTAVYAETLVSQFAVPFIGSATAVYVPTLSAPEVDVPFVASRARVYGVFSLFTDARGTGVGNGGESFSVELAPNGTTETATLAGNISDTATLLTLTGDSGFPSGAFVVLIDDEVLYVAQLAAGSYRIRGRGVSNATAAAHAAGADVTWTDSYDMAIASTENADASFTADIAGSGSFIYPGFLFAFGASQAYLGANRYPMQASMLGVFDAGAGSAGTNRIDAAQPNAVCTATGVSDDCPSEISVPGLITTNIAPGAVALVRYTNPEASILELGPRSISLGTAFGLKRVDDSDIAAPTDPTANIVDGSVNGIWDNPLGPGIAPDTGAPTNHDVPYTSVTLPGTDRIFTFGPPHYSEKGQPIGVLVVRQDNRRIPFWRSWDWTDFGFVYSGFGTDATYAQAVINLNGIDDPSVPEVDLPGPQDIDGPDAVWDDGSYRFASSWYVAIYGAPFFVLGPVLNGSGPTSSGVATSGPVPTVTFDGSGGHAVTFPPNPVKGGSGGGIPAPTAGRQRFYATLV